MSHACNQRLGLPQQVAPSFDIKIGALEGVFCSMV